MKVKKKYETFWSTCLRKKQYWGTDFFSATVLVESPLNVMNPRSQYSWIKTVSYFLYSKVIQTEQLFTVKGDEAGHVLRSRRIQVGEVIQIQDLNVTRFEARVEKLDNRSLTLLPLKQLQTPPESPLTIHLYQALVKEKGLDLIVQKCTELGVSSICFFQSRYSQRLHAKNDSEKKLQRWHRIAIEACKQSGRAVPPGISFISDLSKFQQDSGESSIETIPALCLESSGETVPLESACSKTSTVNLIIGPEGGWSDTELDGLPFQKIQLGPRILRSDTAAISAVTVLQYLYGDLTSPPF